ncbi:S-adenosyl-L-methionine-dependent methyltransferase [Xylaria cf. heliscus]|nr:S-adenosyl-L-methionine-dependent methyltransferase [Xylaria cf. heliscus]
MSQSLSDLGDIIRQQSNTLSNQLQAMGFTPPSLSGNGGQEFVGYPTEVGESREKLLEAIDELRALVLGPNSYLFFASFISPVSIAVFNVIYRYELAQNIPKRGSISYPDLASRCGLAELDVRRVIQAALSLRMFEEQPDGSIGHNAISAALATPLVHDSVGFSTEEYVPAAMKLAEALKRFPGSTCAGESAIAISNGSVGDRDIFSLISHDPARVRRFTNAMSWVTTVPETSSVHFVDNVPWSLAPEGMPQACPKVIVDIGGSGGDLCEALCTKFPLIEKAIVEDLPEVLSNRMEKAIATDLTDRIEYQPYNFFTKQVIKGADVYIFRTVLHDWPDSYAIQILQNQVSALKPGAEILINDICLEDSRSKSRTHLYAQCAHDLMVKMGLNSKERTRDEWAALLSSADARFKIESVTTPPCSVHSIIRVIWPGEA